MTKDEALDLALEALEVEQTAVTMFNLVPKPHITKAITAIKQAKKSNIKQVIHLYDEPPAQPAPVQSAEERSSVERGEPVAFKHVCNLWIDPVSREYIVDHCDHPPSECIPAYIGTPPGGRQSEDCLTAAQEDIQRLSALVRAQQITIDKLEQARSAPVQEPFGYVWFTKHMEHRFTRMKPHPDMGAMNIKPVYTAPPGQEPVAYTTGHCKEKAQPGGCQLHNLHCGYPACDRKAVTTPPAAQRQWVGLTPREIYNLWEDSGVPFVDWDSFASITRAIEAKLKEKNGLHRQHVIDGSPCWCEPETSYTDPETGASVVVHKEPQ